MVITISKEFKLSFNLQDTVTFMQIVKPEHVCFCNGCVFICNLLMNDLYLTKSRHLSFIEQAETI